MTPEWTFYPDDYPDPLGLWTSSKLCLGPCTFYESLQPIVIPDYRVFVKTKD